jgi:hydroxyacylglutathione hydrolase
VTPRVVPPSECLALCVAGASLVDLSEPVEFAMGHPPGAISVRFDDRHLAERVTRVIGVAPRLLLCAADQTHVEPAVRQLADAQLEVIGIAGGAPSDWADARAEWLGLRSLETGDLADDPAQRSYHVLDVREPMEWAVGHVPGAQLIALGEVRERLAEVPTDRDVAVICEAGVRSSSAASLLQAAGVTRVFNVADGTAGWRTSGRRVETTDLTE